MNLSTVNVVFSLSCSGTMTIIFTILDPCLMVNVSTKIEIGIINRNVIDMMIDQDTVIEAHHTTIGE